MDGGEKGGEERKMKRKEKEDDDRKETEKLKKRNEREKGWKGVSPLHAGIYVYLLILVTNCFVAG